MRWFNLTGGGSQTETRQSWSLSLGALGQMTRLTVPGQLDLEYRFSATANDGRATSQKNYLTGEELEYQYDSLGRLTKAETTANSGSAPQWGLSWVYDGFGNRLQQNAVKGTVPTASLLVDPTTNRVQSHTYDANGNTVNTPAQGAMTYDVANRLKTVASDTYSYAPTNQRTWKNNDFVLWGADGARLVTAQVSVIAGELRFTQSSFDSYASGRRLQVVDRLGSVGSYFPYGEAKSGTVSNADSFATYYRDSSALDYAQNRYFQSSSGRFTTTDPAQSSASAANPGSWNRYDYALSDPVNRLDSLGLASTEVGCQFLGVARFFCQATIVSQSGTYLGTSVASQLSSAQRAATQMANVAGGFALTQELLADALDVIAGGLSQACWNNALSRLTGSNVERKPIELFEQPKPLTRSSLAATVATVEFLDGVKYGAFSDDSQDALALFDGPIIFWRPGANGVGLGKNWLLGAVLHEVVHKVTKLSDIEIQKALGIAVDPRETHNISRFLIANCFD